MGVIAKEFNHRIALYRHKKPHSEITIGSNSLYTLTIYPYQKSINTMATPMRQQRGNSFSKYCLDNKGGGIYIGKITYRV